MKQYRLMSFLALSMFSSGSMDMIVDDGQPERRYTADLDPPAPPPGQACA